MVGGLAGSLPRGSATGPSAREAVATCEQRECRAGESHGRDPPGEATGSGTGAAVLLLLPAWAAWS